MSKHHARFRLETSSKNLQNPSLQFTYNVKKRNRLPLKCNRFQPILFACKKERWDKRPKPSFQQKRKT